MKADGPKPRRLGAARDYADYREMLEREKPDLVAIGPRWATEHHAMAMASLQAGAHLYLENPSPSPSPKPTKS